MTERFLGNKNPPKGIPNPAWGKSGKKAKATFLEEIL
jgi:hypothetical protein